MKICSKCEEEKDESEFHKRKDAKDGLRDQCKLCVNARKAEWRDENIEKSREYQRNYYKNNPEKKKESVRKWREENKEAYNSGQRNWRKNNLEKSREHQRKFRENNVEKLRRIKREYMRENSDYYSQKNLERQKRLDKEDPDFRYARSLRGSFRNVLKGYSSRTMCHLNYSELIKKIEMQFEEGMSWENYGEWHVDHKKPMSRFIKQGEYRPSLIYALSNLQPMWASENCSKRDNF